VGLEQGPLSLVSTTEELLGRNSSCSGLESREYGHRDSSRWPRGNLYPQKNVGTNFADKRRSLGRYSSLGRNPELSIYNKLILYKEVLRPVWTYGIQLWWYSSDSNLQVIQRFQNKVLKCIVQASWYIRNSDLHRDLGIETVTDIITRLASSRKKRLQNHINSEVSRLLKVQNIPRRLKRKKQFQIFPPQDGHKTETCSGYWLKYSNQCCVRRKPWTWPSTRNRMQTTNSLKREISAWRWS
jgi:hypothetical protein